MHNRPPRPTRHALHLLAASALLLVGLEVAGAVTSIQEPEGPNPNRRREYPDTPFARRVRAVDPTAFEFRHAHLPLADRVRAVRRAIARGLMTPAGAEAAGLATAVTGSFRYPVIVGRFAPPDDWSGFDLAELGDRLFGVGYHGDDHSGSLRDFYDAVSFGRIAMAGDICGYAAVDSAADHYRDSSGDSVDDHLLDWIEELVAAVDDTVDFSRYDADADGIVDVLILVHNLKGYECSGLPHQVKGFWSHRWSYPAASYWLRGQSVYLATGDDDPHHPGQKMKIADYILQPLGECSGGMIDVGVFCHEMGHAFGLPDLYDTDGGGSGGESEGLGHWALMASGNWNKTWSPAAMCAWSRYDLGWYENLIVLDGTDAVSLALPDVYRSGTIVLLHSTALDEEEYFLVENRQRYGFDAWLHGTGLLIYHLNEAVPSFNRNPADLRWALEQADGLFQLERNDNRGDAGDPWPGAMQNLHFWSGSVPASTARSGADSQVEIVLHTTSADTMVVDLFTTPSFPLTAPTGGGFITDRTPQLSWAAYPPPPEWSGVRYAVELDTTDAFTTSERDTTAGTTLAWSGELVENRLWYWRVSAFDEFGHRRVNRGGPAVFIVDATPPELTLGALRNPALTDHLDLVVVSNEVPTVFTLTADGIPRDPVPIPATGAAIVRADLELAPGSIAIQATGTDAAGNRTSVEAVLQVVIASPGHPFTLVSPDGLFTARAGAGAVWRTGAAALLQSAGRYLIDLPERVPGRSIEIVIGWDPRSIGPGESPVIWRRSGEHWEALPTALDLSAATATALVEEGGTFELRSGERGALLPPAGTTLEPPWPNPFNPRTRLAFTLAESGSVRLTIVDVRGRSVRILADGSYPAGRHLLTWDGTDTAGRPAATGVYLAVLETRYGRLVRKLTLLR